jgi:hypothetical protein
LVSGYRGDSLVLEHEFETAGGAMRLIDFMPDPHRLPFGGEISIQRNAEYFSRRHR